MRTGTSGKPILWKVALTHLLAFVLSCQSACFVAGEKQPTQQLKGDFQLYWERFII
jgi:hypothetical protein